MKTWMALLAAGLMLTAVPVIAQETTKPAKEEPAEASGSPKTGGDTRPSAVDPAQSTTTGANAGEGASYNRSTEKGDSVMPKDGAEKESADKTK